MARKSNARAEPEPQRKSWLAWVLGSSDDFEGYFAQSRSLALSFVLVAPLLLIYEIALVHYRPARPTATKRVVDDLLFAVFSTRAGLALNIIVFLFLVLAVIALARRRRLKVGLIVPMLLESAGLAVALVGIAVLLYRGLTNVPLEMAPAGSRIALKVIGAVGAGVYEEILFRLLLTSLLYLAGLKLFSYKSFDAALFAIIISALIFAGCHVMVLGTRSRLDMLFYFISGVFFGALYTWRGLGVAVYTHVIYDMIIFLAER